MLSFYQAELFVQANAFPGVGHVSQKISALASEYHIILESSPIEALSCDSKAATVNSLESRAPKHFKP